ncbi:MAG: lysoplasmalogenase [Pedobacter sp.]|nr:MAG: lysoplasmalogenase [Pedobacter sp.]
MFRKYAGFTILFASIAALQLCSIYGGYSLLHIITKVMITLSLMITLVFTTRLRGRFHKRVFAGLLFAMAGDIFLLMDSESGYFMAGLGCFLIGHLCYISAFYLDFRSAPELDKKGARLAILAGIILSCGFYLWLRPYLGPLRLPVLTYIFVITLMMMMAAFRNLRVDTLSFKLILAGAVCFMASDAMLASDRFIAHFPNSGLAIMFTYMLAQYLIVIGAMERTLIIRDPLV